MHLQPGSLFALTVCASLCGPRSAVAELPTAHPATTAGHEVHEPPVSSANRADQSSSRASTSELDETAHEANADVVVRTRLDIKPAYTFVRGGGYVVDLQIQPTIPYSGYFIPGLVVPGFVSIARADLYARSFHDSGASASGLTDLTFTDVVARSFGPLILGAGFASVFPMATSPSLGRGALQLGPAVVIALRDIPHLDLSLLVRNYYSIVSSDPQNPRVGHVSVQPSIAVRFAHGFFLRTNATMDFYWEGGTSTVPVNLGVGRAFDRHFSGALEGWYTIAGSHQGDVKVVAALSFIL